MRTRQSKTIFCGVEKFALPRLFFGFGIRRAGECGRNARRIFGQRPCINYEIVVGYFWMKSMVDFSKPVHSKQKGGKK